ncbi:DsbA family oxidoreductase [Sapientia aquatica]|uniref:DsbA family oxidoreductase n=1 Tax=Sapientia aquatica TaxID=1549640 RepID=A0A4V3AU22_9BURK|nr:DsbA family oxidoreductase [Sapientia aquatica]TDK62757.1 DsbA family oxidoreductase [Sapientia aquatica]
MKIDFVSDIACPWCAVGLNSLEMALKNIGTDIPTELQFHPYELNPTMAPEGADSAEYLRAKYGMSAEQLAQGRANLHARGAAVGFNFGERTRVWNTFDAHRLLYWAGLQSAEQQRQLKHAFLKAYHGEGRNPADQSLMLDLAVAAGLERDQAQDVISSQRYADEVRAEEQFWQQAGIQSVPSIIINNKHLITGGQTPDVFEQVLRDIAAQATEKSTQQAS